MRPTGLPNRLEILLNCVCDPKQAYSGEWGILPGVRCKILGMQPILLNNQTRTCLLVLQVEDMTPAFFLFKKKMKTKK